MPLRLLLAWICGWIVYMVAMMMTTYDGFPSMVLQPIMGAAFTSIGVFFVVLLGLPLMFSKIWKMWTRVWWLSIVIVFVSITMIVLSWLPSNRVMVYNPELSSEIESFHPVLSIAGWFGMLFGLVWSPLLSIRNLLSWFQKTVKNAKS